MLSEKLHGIILSLSGLSSLYRFRYAHVQQSSVKQLFHVRQSYQIGKHHPCFTAVSFKSAEARESASRSLFVVGPLHHAHDPVDQLKHQRIDRLERIEDLPLCTRGIARISRAQTARTKS